MSKKKALPPAARESQTGSLKATSKGHIVDKLSSEDDMVEHNKPEDEFASEMEWLEIVTKNIGAGLAIISSEYQTLWANEVLKDLFGDCVGKVCYIHYNQRDEICPGCGVRDIFQNGAEKAIHEQMGRDSAGNIVWSQIIATPIRDREGNITAVLELVVPITERKRTEDLLKDSENKYRAIFENTGTAMLIIEGDTTISLVNEEFEKLTGYSREEVEGKKSWTDFIVKEDLERMLHQHRLRRENPSDTKRNYEFRGKDRSGQIRDVLLTIGMIPGTKKSVASLLDITERKRTEDLLKDSENKYRAIFENTGNATVIIDEDTTISLVNEEFVKQTGYSKEEVEGKKSWTDFIVEEDLERMLHQHHLRRENPSDTKRNYEFRGKDKSGQIRDVLLTIGMIPGTKKSVASLLDITERKQMETALLSFLRPKGRPSAKRDKSEIIESILQICKNGAKKTEIVYKTNLNFKKAEASLQWLIDRELIVRNEKLFKITPKGSEFLANLQCASATLDLK